MAKYAFSSSSSSSSPASFDSSSSFFIHLFNNTELADIYERKAFACGSLLISVFQDDAAHGTAGLVKGVEGKGVNERSEVEYTEVVKDETGNEGVVEEEGAGRKEMITKKMNEANSLKKLNRFIIRVRSD
ncbi:uncharacterized protein MONOS_12799 [Monocercomonoides exilis]|uniref:uncharacterized protein n=1 Tax=Monocercomonoides exilis TaxID=2049356 RepID=UPI00355A1B32|nr:hypothetical protein MONOS_12799 [Monocercomonoides exilis]|eukprot:MONOS_12799.1-p1 / transcript=MONOS_12799.1 / gene=MONOS_12799 / organism=Monocercomonoides_exilis_PA203 / gene_product=unspecified product / transcript_product=unspecified product / location=Mono_scaffold00734:15720-16109(-) / protein_length=130 / sequence_SO=supercontig / SO=protein_coding / is_pseudo=false